MISHSNARTAANYHSQPSKVKTYYHLEGPPRTTGSYFGTTKKLTQRRQVAETQRRERMVRNRLGSDANKNLLLFAFMDVFICVLFAVPIPDWLDSLIFLLA